MSCRRLLKNPGSTAIAVFMMALGIALTTSMFTVIDGSVLRGLPFEESDRLLHLELKTLTRGPFGARVPLHDFADWRSQQQSFEDLSGLDPTTVNLSDEHLPERYPGVRVSACFLDLLRVQPLLGRGFTAADELPDAPPVVLIGYHVWQQRYAADPGIVGRTVRVNSEPATVVGVLPQGFRFPFRHDVWLPLRVDTSDLPRGDGPRIGVFGRLKDGVSPEQAAAEMATIARRLEEQYPDTNRGVGVVVEPYINAFIDERAQLSLGVMFVAVLLVLLIASINVANLLMIRASLRSHELAVSSALGAGRSRAVAQVLSEAGLLAAGAMVLGVLLARWVIGVLSSTIEQMDPPFWVKFQMDTRALLVTLAVTVVAALVAGLGPALKASSLDLNRVLQDTARGSSSFRMGWMNRMSVVLQVAISFPLLIGAGLTVRTVGSINDYDLHFEPEHVLSARLAIPRSNYPQAREWTDFFQELRSRLVSEPGVVSVGVGSAIPMDTTAQAAVRYVCRGKTYDKPETLPVARWTVISPGYFEALGVEVRSGRAPRAGDDETAPKVAWVSEALAAREWPGQSAIGQRLRVWWSAEREPEDPEAGWAEVVGVVPNLHWGDFDNPSDAPALYLPLSQSPQPAGWIVVRTSQAPTALAESLRRTVRQLDPDLPLFYVRSMGEVLERATFFPILLSAMFSAFGVAAVILAAIGLYGVIAFGVTRRTREMGVRMALGATRGDVLKLVVKHGLLRASAGLILGLLLAVPLAFAISGSLFHVAPMDPLTFLLIPLLLLLVAAAASLLPAARAASVNLIEVLRYE